MDKSKEILSNFVIHTRYASFLPELNRRQTWDEIVTENKKMMIKKYPQLEDEIEEKYKLVYDKKILPSMRSLQYGGLPIEINPARIYNCSFMNITEQFCFSEVLFLLLCGTGVGFSVQKRHIEKIPKIIRPNGTTRYLVQDSIEGWADAVRFLFNAYIKGKALPIFDYSDIRPKGSIIKKSGGRAPGHEQLKSSLEEVEKILNYVSKRNRGLKPIEVHDIICHISDCVSAGGVRASALISLFDFTDYDMIRAKSSYNCQVIDIIEEISSEGGNLYKIKINSDIQIYSEDKTITVDEWTYNSILETKKIGWWVVHPQRARSNNSAICLRHAISKEQFDIFWKMVEDSKSGEPGIYWTNDLDAGTNPCAEIGINSNQFCNLTTINASIIQEQEQLDEAAEAATFIGTLQAGFNNFHYLRPIWKQVTDAEALLGVSMTGVVEGNVMNLDMKKSVQIAQETNRRIAKAIGINCSARITAIKPEGSSSLVIGSSGSGVHPAFSEYYIRRVRMEKSHAIYDYLSTRLPKEFLEDDIMNPRKAIISMPIYAPSNSKYANVETAMDMLERVKFLHENWIEPGHNYGANTHNVSATIYIKDGEWSTVGSWMYERRDRYNGLSVLGYSDNTYQQMPFEAITKDKYEELMILVDKLELDFTEILEFTDQTSLQSSLACQGGSCIIM